MKVQTITERELTPKQLAEALANGTPEDFFSVFIELNKIRTDGAFHDSKQRVKDYAKCIGCEFYDEDAKAARQFFVDLGKAIESFETFRRFRLDR